MFPSQTKEAGAGSAVVLLRRKRPGARGRRELALFAVTDAHFVRLHPARAVIEPYWIDLCYIWIGYGLSLPPTMPLKGGFGAALSTGRSIAHFPSPPMVSNIREQRELRNGHADTHQMPQSKLRGY